MNVYGPRQEGGLIMSVLQRLRVGQPPIIMGDGMQSFDFIHVADATAANLLAMASDITNEAFNVGSGTEVTAKEIVERLLALTDSDRTPKFCHHVQVPMTRRVGSNRKAVELLHWQPTYDLESGLRDLIAMERGQ